MRKRVRLAAANNIKNMGSDLHSDVAVPVTFVSRRFRFCMPTGRFICPISPARKRIWYEKGRMEEEEKMRK
jgi:hypothetical protein